MTQKPASIRDVADLAGVSPATVSNVLGGRRPVSEALTARVRKAASDLSYQVDRAASQLRSGKAKVVAILVPDLDNPFFTAIVSAVERCLCQERYEVIVASSGGDGSVEASRLSAILAWRPAGLVVIPCSDAFPGRSLIERAGVPYVIADRVTDAPAADTVSVDNEEAGALGARHLVERGHEEILIAASVLELANIRERCAGAAEVLRQHGLPAPGIVELGLSFEVASERLSRWFDHHRPPTAILALTNFTTLGVLATVAGRQLAIPQDVSLIGFDDYAWMRARATPLTAIGQPVREMGRAIWERLSARIAGDASAPRHVRLSCELNVRASVARLAEDEGSPADAGAVGRTDVRAPKAGEAIVRKALLFGSAAIGLAVVASGARAQTDWSTVLSKHDGEAVNIMSIQDPFIDAVRKISPKFEALTGAKVTTDGYGYDPLHEKEILGCSQSDGQYDVLFIDGIWVGEFVEAECIDPVEDVWGETDPKLIAWEDYVESFAGQAVWDGKKQCLPVGAYWQMVHYRKDLFDKAGLEAPTTLKETMDAAKLFTKNPDYPGMTGYAMNNRRGAAAGQQYFEWIYSNGGKPWESNYPGSTDPYGDQKPLLNSPQSVSIVQFMKDMVPYGPAGVEQFAWDERFNAFAQGNVAMINAWSVQTPGLNDPAVSKVVGKWDVAMMPHAEGAESVPPVGGWIMCLNKHGSRKEAAWDFMRWFASPEVHKEWVLLGAPPSRHSTFQDPEVTAAQPWVPTLYETAKAAWIEGRPRHALTFEMIDAIGLQVNRAIIGEATPQEAMDTANSNVTEMLEAEGYLE